jgi:hypothetical protein
MNIWQNLARLLWIIHVALIAKNDIVQIFPKSKNFIYVPCCKGKKGQSNSVEVLYRIKQISTGKHLEHWTANG